MTHFIRVKMIFSENGYRGVNCFCNICLNWKVNLAMGLVISVQQRMLSSAVQTASATWPIVMIALWIVTNYCHFTES